MAPTPEAEHITSSVVRGRSVAGRHDRAIVAALRRQCSARGFGGGEGRGRIAAQASRGGLFIATLVVTAIALTCSAGAASRLSYEDTVRDGESTSFRILVRRPAAFSINLKAPTAGRTRLFLEGSNAPQGGPLMDTKTTDCEGAAGTLSCSRAYQALPKGAYTFRMKFTGGEKARLRLVVRW